MGEAAAACARDGVCSASRSLSVLGVGADVDYLEQFGASSVSAPPGRVWSSPVPLSHGGEPDTS